MGKTGIFPKKHWNIFVALTSPVFEGYNTRTVFENLQTDERMDERDSLGLFYAKSRDQKYVFLIDLETSKGI